MKLYKVGGWVRDSILGIQSKDIDYSVETESYDQMKEELTKLGATIFLETPEYVTCKAKYKGEVADFVLCRKDGAYRDGRRPDMVTIGNIYDDLARRDFTMNAIAIDGNGKYLDPHNGLQDINDKIIRCVGSTDRLKEDSLRMLRALRFSITKGFDMTEDIEAILYDDYFLLENISRERIAEELKLMFSFSTSKSFETMVQYSNLFKFIFENCNVTLTSVLPHIK